MVFAGAFLSSIFNLGGFVWSFLGPLSPCLSLALQLFQIIFQVYLLLNNFVHLLLKELIK